MNRILISLLLVLSIASASHAVENKSAAGTWSAAIGDTTYTLVLKTRFINDELTVEVLDGSLTAFSMGPRGVTTRTMPATAQIIAKKESVILSFGEPGNKREHATGIFWGDSMEVILFSARPGQVLDYHGAADFSRVGPPPVTD